MNARRWMNRFRRILVPREKPSQTFIAMLHLTCGISCLASNRPNIPETMQMMGTKHARDSTRRNPRLKILKAG
jgi:hypothetical protein